MRAFITRKNQKSRNREESLNRKMAAEHIWQPCQLRAAADRPPGVKEHHHNRQDQAQDVEVVLSSCAGILAHRLPWRGRFFARRPLLHAFGRPAYLWSPTRFFRRFALCELYAQTITPINPQNTNTATRAVRTIPPLLIIVLSCVNLTRSFPHRVLTLIPNLLAPSINPRAVQHNRSIKSQRHYHQHDAHNRRAKTRMVHRTRFLFRLAIRAEYTSRPTVAATTNTTTTTSSVCVIHPPSWPKPLQARTISAGADAPDVPLRFPPRFLPRCRSAARCRVQALVSCA